MRELNSVEIHYVSGGADVVTVVPVDSTSLVENFSTQFQKLFESVFSTIVGILNTVRTGILEVLNTTPKLPTPTPRPELPPQV
ncbi:MAG: hypothetical protein LBE78_10525 [Burkholderiaceae bacterium]|jgi:hypothetical protein|nr:hypothetical protein [Burkholderiaceae bacterium]